MTIQSPIKLDVIHPRDRIYSASTPAHYRYVGQSFLEVAQAAIALRNATAGAQPIGRILDFGAGYGRVTRVMRATWPEAEIVASDIDEEAIRFCAANFACTPHRSASDVTTIAFDGSFDLMWLGSVVTHLDAAKTAHLLRKLAASLAPHGLLLVSSHGRRALDRLILKLKGPEAEFSWYGLLRERALELLRDYSETGFGYIDYAQRDGYGVSLITLDWLMRLVSSLGDYRLAAYMEAVWDQHHDVIAVQRTPLFYRLAV